MMSLAEEKAAQGAYAEAADLFKKTIAMNPESQTAVRSLYRLGFTLESNLKDMDGAIFNYTEFIRLARDRVSIYEVQKRIANIYFEQFHDADKAIAAYRKLIAYDPNSLEIDLFQFRIAQSYFQQNSFEQARHEYQQLLERYPKSQYNARARFEIGNTYYMEGRYDIAIEALKQVMRHNPQSEYANEAQFLMAECMEQEDKPEAAYQLYESIQGRYSSPEILAYRVSELKKRMKQKR
jgi:TolA-binding protein